jgi:hypothetical protein
MVTFLQKNSKFDIPYNNRYMCIVTCFVHHIGVHFQVIMNLHHIYMSLQSFLVLISNISQYSTSIELALQFHFLHH